MNKLMTSLFAATIVGAFSMSAIAATAPAAPAAPAASAVAEKPADAPKKHVAKKHAAKKHVAKAAGAATPAMPAEPAK
jgi:hypothetical protein